MFEGKIPSAAPHRPLFKGEEQAGELRPVLWGELVARLAAARELRSAIHGGEAEGDASFDADSARKLASRGDGKLSVNLEDLANGKPAGGKYRRTADDATFGDPRK